MKRQHIKRVTSLFVAVLMLSQTGPAVYGETSSEVSVPQYFPMELSKDAPTEILSYSKGSELLAGANYSDTSKNTFVRELTKLSAYGIVRKYGNSEFKPTSDITGYEALSMLVRARNREAAVQTRIQRGATGLNNTQLQRLTNQEYGNEAVALGYLTAPEVVNLDKPINREKLAIWTARAANVAPNFNDLTGTFSYKDAQEVTPINRNLIEALVTEKLFFIGNDQRFRPKSNMTKGEFVGTVERLSDRFKTNLGLTTEFGLVIGRKPIIETQAGVRITKTLITVKSVDGKLVTLRSQYNPKTKVRNEFVSFKNGIVSDSRAIAIGDEIEYTTKGNQTHYVEVINDDTLLDKMKEAEENGTNVVTHFGAVSEIVNKTRFNGTKYIDSKQIRLKDFDGNLYDLVIEADPKTGIKNDVIVYKSGNAGNTSLLKTGDPVEYYVKNNKNITFMKVAPISQKSLVGTVREVGLNEALKTNTVTLYDYNDSIKEYPVAQHALVTINGAYAKLAELPGGQEVKLTVKNGYITNIVAETDPDQPGGIPSFGKMRSGEVYMTYADSAIFNLSNGQRMQYTLPVESAIIKGGAKITLKALKPGDKVKLYFSDMYSTRVDRIEVEGAERLISQIYKGDIQDFNSSSGVLSLASPNVLKNNGWKALDTYTVEIPVDENTQIFEGSSRVEQGDLFKLFKDKTAYVVVENAYGTNKAAKISIRNGGEMMTYDSVIAVDTVQNSMELYNKENYTFNEGTIVVKDNRLLDPSRIKLYDSAFVISDYYMGNKNLSVVKLIPRAEAFFDNLYIGAIYTVDSNSVTFKNHARLSANQWSSVDSNVSKRFFYTSETGIVNRTPDPAVAIKPQEFFNKGFGEEENKDKNNQGLKYERYYGIFVTNGTDVIQALTLRYKGLVLGQNIDDGITDEALIKAQLEDILKTTGLIRGTVEAIDTKWQRLQLTDSNEWSPTLAEWRTNNVDVYAFYKEALIIKEGKVIDSTGIKTGDSVYILKNKEQGLIVFVESK